MKLDRSPQCICGHPIWQHLANADMSRRECWDCECDQYVAVAKRRVAIYYVPNIWQFAVDASNTLRVKFLEEHDGLTWNDPGTADSYIQRLELEQYLYDQGATFLAEEEVI